MSETISISVNGMKCGGCEKTINTALSEVDGILSVSASHQDSKVDVEFDPDKIDVESIEDAIEDAGFNVA
jgi:copper chaperone